MKFNFVYLLSATLLSVALKNTSVLSQSQEDTDLILDIPEGDFNDTDIENGTAAEPDSIPSVDVAATAPGMDDTDLTGDVPDSSNAPPVVDSAPDMSDSETDDLPELTDSLTPDEDPQTITDNDFDFTDIFTRGTETDSEFTQTAQPVDDGTVTVTMYVTLPPVTGTVIVDQYGNPITTIIPGENGEDEIEDTEAPTETGPNPGAVSEVESEDTFTFDPSATFTDDFDDSDLSLDIPDDTDLESSPAPQTSVAPETTLVTSTMPASTATQSSQTSLPSNAASASQTTKSTGNTETLASSKIDDGDDLNEVPPEDEDLRAALSAPAINDADDLDVDDIKQKLDNNGDSTEPINLF
ncbi:hypothetical protein AYI70_g1801 [Smittium culicis]|uniref:Uncharacterized protein n=1 Tax=Smittium culicis TaxID=133412 RepID=A0A1R1YB89_9FUNG|nr:hypothetical protein AYI70_g1801 [Smittium culicis]